MKQSFGKGLESLIPKKSAKEPKDAERDKPMLPKQENAGCQEQ